jgi:D-alanyl-D-alanine carboxypeptidase (penicillin-binding protein 5/6)
MKRLFPALLIFTLAAPAWTQQESGPLAPEIDPVGMTAAYVIESDTGRELYAYNAHTPLPTASMAKMMTLLIAMDEIQAGNLSYDTQVTISPRASRMGGSQVYLRAGSVWPVKNLLIATMVHSANDAAQALAEKIGGSSEAFADLMNHKARSLGLKESRFYDPHGLPADTPGQDNVMSAHDLAMLGRELMKHPFMRALAVVPEMEFRNGTLERIYNPNRLLGRYEGVTGIKTGYTGGAGFCITASARRNDMDVIAVVMGAKTSRGPDSSFELAAKLMNQAFVNFKMVTPVKEGTVVGQASVTKGRASSVPVVASRNASALVKRGEEREVSVRFDGGAVAAPVRKGQPVGTILVQRKGETVAKIPAVAAKDVPEQPWWKAFWPF